MVEVKKIDYFLPGGSLVYLCDSRFTKTPIFLDGKFDRYEAVLRLSYATALAIKDVTLIAAAAGLVKLLI